MRRIFSCLFLVFFTCGQATSAGLAGVSLTVRPIRSISQEQTIFAVEALAGRVGSIVERQPHEFASHFFKLASLWRSLPVASATSFSFPALPPRDERGSVADPDLESKALDALADQPLSGKELMNKLPFVSADLLWQVVMLSHKIQKKFAGVHYPRIALKKNPPTANLSPSPFREFYSYTAVARTGDPRLPEKVKALEQLRNRLSARRLRQARAIVYELAHQFAHMKIAILLSGDVARGMAHEEKRYNLVSGELMDGSDFDFIVLAQDSAKPQDLQKIHSAFMWALDVMSSQGVPPVEVDFDVFRIADVARLAPNDAVDLMHAKNILQSELIFGDAGLVAQAKTALHHSHVTDKLKEVTRHASQSRRKRTMTLLLTDVNAWIKKDIEFFLGSFESFAEAAKLIRGTNRTIPHFRHAPPAVSAA
jgi:hypothetical protein